MDASSLAICRRTANPCDFTHRQKCCRILRHNLSGCLLDKQLDVPGPFWNMQINRATDYAVRVMVQLAILPPGTKQQLTSLERATGVRGSFLSKVLQRLVHAGLIASHRGNGGGFCLRVDRDQTTLLEVIEAMEGPMYLNQCLISGLSCERKPWCSVHPVWERAQIALREIFTSVSIGQLAGDTTASSWKSRQPMGSQVRAEAFDGAELAASNGKSSRD